MTNSKGLMAAALAVCLSSCAGCAEPRLKEGETADFDFPARFGSVSEVDFVCHYASFNGEWTPISAAEIEDWCDCEISDAPRLRYRETLFVIKNGRISQAEAGCSSLGYSGTLEDWRSEPSFCFSADRITADNRGNPVIAVPG